VAAGVEWASVFQVTLSHFHAVGARSQSEAGILTRGWEWVGEWSEAIGAS
jgi:hypothetical protein